MCRPAPRSADWILVIICKCKAARMPLLHWRCVPAEYKENSCSENWLQDVSKYPWTGEIRGKKFTFRPMTPEDRDATLAFTSGLSHSDILFLQSDITKPEVIDEWISSVKGGRAFVLLAFNSSHEMVGYASLYHNENSWARHQADTK